MTSTEIMSCSFENSRKLKLPKHNPSKSNPSSKLLNILDNKNLVIRLVGRDIDDNKIVAKGPYGFK